MTEDRSNPDNRPSFSPSQDRGQDRSWDPDSSPDGPSMGDRSAFALDMARMWVKEHQTATMLGAFAAGVFVGSLLRD